MSSAAGTDHKVAAAGTPAAGSWGGELRLVRGSLLWAHQNGKAAGTGSAGNAAGSRKAPEAAAAAESPAAAGPRELPSSTTSAATPTQTHTSRRFPLFFCPQHSGLSMGSSSLGSQWSDGVGMWAGPGGMDGKGVSGGSSSSIGMWDEAVKNQASLRGNANNNMGLKNSRSSPSLRYKCQVIASGFLFFFFFN